MDGPQTVHLSLPSIACPPLVTPPLVPCLLPHCLPSLLSSPLVPLKISLV